MYNQAAKVSSLGEALLNSGLNILLMPAAPRYWLAGQLRRNFYIPPSGLPQLDVPGGGLLYAAVGALVWETDSPPGLVARVGEDYPQGWLSDLTRRGLDTRGIRILPDVVDVRTFFAYSDRNTRQTDDPVAHFARIGHPFPKALLGYRAPTTPLDSRTRLLPTSLRQSDIPPEYLEATAAHLCPVDYLTHTLLPAVLRQAGFTTVTLDPSPGTMIPAFWDDIPPLLTGLTAFLPSETELRALFHGHTTDLWEMAEALAAYRCDYIVIKCGERGQLLYDSTSRTRWEIPAYPARLADPTGAGDAFCGGFLEGYRRSLDPLEAVLYGNISASLVIEGSGLFYALAALPGLAQARLEALRQYVRKI
jgi:sugar/nucleoside kinase (ribokinase family)